MRLGACGLPQLGAAAGSISLGGSGCWWRVRAGPRHILREVTQQGCVRRAPCSGDEEDFLAAS